MKNSGKRKKPSSKRDEMELGSRCFVKSLRPAGVHRKLSKKWEGPYRIMKNWGKNRYELCDLRTLKTKIFHADNIKLVPEAVVSRKVVQHARDPYPQLRGGIPSRGSEMDPDPREEDKREGQDSDSDSESPPSPRRHPYALRSRRNVM